MVMIIRKYFAGYLTSALFGLVIALAGLSSTARADLSTSSEGGPTFFAIWEKAQKGKKGRLGYHYYWDDGFRIDSPGKKLRIKMNLLINLDADLSFSLTIFATLKNFQPKSVRHL